MKILIVEDEASIAERIQRMVLQITDEQKAIIKIASTFDQAASYFSENTIDLLLLDLNLNGHNGFQFLQQATAGSFHTIIISAHQEKAIEAFEFGVLDFVSKPFTYERLEKAFERYRQKTATGITAKCLAIKVNRSIRLIRTEDVKYIKANGDYSYFYLSDNSKLLHDKSLENLEAILEPLFLRIHKSYIVKLSSIKNIHVSPGSKYEAELISGEFLPLGRTKYKTLKEVLLK